MFKIFCFYLRPWTRNYIYFKKWGRGWVTGFNFWQQMFQIKLSQCFKCFKWNFCSSRTTTVPKLFWNPYINVQLIAQTSSVYDYFIIWPSSVTLTFNLSKQLFQIPVALLLLKDNNFAILFWNPCLNIQVMARTSSIYDHFIIWPSSVTLTFNLPEQMFQMALLLLEDNNCAKLFCNPCIRPEFFYFLVLGKFLGKPSVGGGNKNKNKIQKFPESE